jgi:HD superfamily phosphodiesterase
MTSGTGSRLPVPFFAFLYLFNLLTRLIYKATILYLGGKIKPNYEKAKEFAFYLLEKLPEFFTHHNKVHTQRVLDACIELGKLEQISKDKQLLLNTAALYHDTGYLIRYNNNEKFGAKTASNILPFFDYSAGQIKEINNIIYATRVNYLPGKISQLADPKNILEKIICDADLFHLGHPNFQKEKDRLRTELNDIGSNISKYEWAVQQLNFLQGHEYLTVSARKLRNEQKEKNKLTLIKFIEKSKKKHH